MSRHEQQSTPAMRHDDRDLVLAEETMAGAARVSSEASTEGEDPFGGTVHAETSTLERINALNEERRRLLNRSAYGLDAVRRAERLRQIKEELEKLWLQRRLELSRRPAERPDWLYVEDAAN